jgi:hypothetical protein
MSVITTLTWFVYLLKVDVEHRIRARMDALNLIRFFNKGRKSKLGEQLYNDLNNGKLYEFVGFAPNIFYAKESGTKTDMSVQWVHPFSSPTLLYKHKKLPILIISNGNLEFNESRLRSIDKNSTLQELQDILGITG